MLANPHTILNLTHSFSIILPLKFHGFFFHIVNMNRMKTPSVSLYNIGNNYVGMVQTGRAWAEKTALAD